MLKNLSKFNLSGARLIEQPFAHFMHFDVFPNSVSLSLLKRLEEYTAWKRVATDFYDQYESKLANPETSDPLSSICSERFLNVLKLQLAGIFGVSLHEKVDVTIHKLTTGQYI